MWAVGALGVPLNLNAFGIQPRFYVFKTAREKKRVIFIYSKINMLPGCRFTGKTSSRLIPLRQVCKTLRSSSSSSSFHSIKLTNFNNLDTTLTCTAAGNQHAWLIIDWKDEPSWHLRDTAVALNIFFGGDIWHHCRRWDNKYADSSRADIMKRPHFFSINVRMWMNNRRRTSCLDETCERVTCISSSPRESLQQIVQVAHLLQLPTVSRPGSSQSSSCEV